MSDRPPRRLVVCAPAAWPELFPDNKHGTCDICRTEVVYRPYIPARRVLVCLQCFIVHAEPGASWELQTETLDELRELGFEP